MLPVPLPVGPSVPVLPPNTLGVPVVVEGVVDVVGVVVVVVGVVPVPFPVPVVVL